MTPRWGGSDWLVLGFWEWIIVSVLLWEAALCLSGNATVSATTHRWCDAWVWVRWGVVGACLWLAWHLAFGAWPFFGE